MIGNYRDVIIAPVITEKSAKIAEKGNKIAVSYTHLTLPTT